MNNQGLADIFYEMADILEMQNIAWKPIAYRNAARTIESLKKDVAQIYKEGGLKEIENIPNIGEGIGKKIKEYLKTRKIREHQRLLRTIPAHIREMMKIPGLGPKKIQKLNRTLKITNIKQLEKAAKAHKIAKIPTFGRESEQDILEAISLTKGAKGKISLKQAEKTANEIISRLKKLKSLKKISVAGSIRRKKPFIRDIDIIASSDRPQQVVDAFTKLPSIRKILAKGQKKAMIVLKSGIQADIRVFEPNSWGAGLFYFTGSKNYNIRIRRIAIKKGYKLNEYGLFDNRTNKLLAGKTEQEICKKLGIKYLSPEKRI